MKEKKPQTENLGYQIKFMYVKHNFENNKYNS